MRGWFAPLMLAAARGRRRPVRWLLPALGIALAQPQRKIIVVDGKQAFVGSENISTYSLDKNRELGILVSDNTVISTLQQTFQQDWGVSQPAFFWGY